MSFLSAMMPREFEGENMRKTSSCIIDYNDSKEQRACGVDSLRPEWW